MSRCGDHAFFCRVKHYDICVASRCDGTFIRIYPIKLCRILTEKPAHLLSGDLTCFDSIGIQKCSPCLNSWKSSRDLCKIIFSQSFLFQSEAALICRYSLDFSICQCLPQAVLIFFLADRRCTYIDSTFKIRFGIHTVIQKKILRTGFCINLLAVLSCIDYFFIGFFVGKMNNHNRCVGFLRDHKKAVNRFCLHGIRSYKRMIFRSESSFFLGFGSQSIDHSGIFTVNSGKASTFA